MLKKLTNGICEIYHSGILESGMKINIQTVLMYF